MLVSSKNAGYNRKQEHTIKPHKVSELVPKYKMTRN
jgi:hypothetical protein